MQTQLDIGNEILTIGNKCIITTTGVINGFGQINTLFSIQKFKQTENNKTLIGLHSFIYEAYWNDLDGEVLPGHGLWVRPSDFTNNLHLLSKKYKVNTNFIFKNQNLKLMECRILYIYDKNNVFVEMDKNIGGISCDGLGKTGHCITLPRNNLKKIKIV